MCDHSHTSHITSAGSNPSSHVKQHRSWSLVITRLDYCNSLLAECSSAPRVQLTKILPCNPPLPRPPLTHGNRSHYVQDTGTGLQGYQRNCPYLPPNVSQAPHLISSALPTTSARHLVPPSLKTGKHRFANSQLFSVLAPQWWNELPADIRTAESLTSDHKRLKTHLF